MALKGKLGKKSLVFICISVALVALVLLFCLIAFLTINSSAKKSFKYVRVDEGYCITEYVGNAAQMEIPSKLDGLPVVGIADNAFASGSKVAEVVSVKLPKTLKWIGKNAFVGMGNLTAVFVPAEVEKIGEHAFYGLEKLAKVEFADGSKILDIGYEAFGNTAFLSEFENGTDTFLLSEDGKILFDAKYFEEELFLPGSVEVIAADAFAYNRSIKVFDITDTVSSLRAVSSGAFRNSTIELFNTFADDEVVNNIDGRLRYVGDGAFEYCVELDSFLVSGGVERIGERAFLGCRKLSQFYAPCGKNLVFGDNAFEGCNNLILALDAGSQNIAGALESAIDVEEPNFSILYYSGNVSEENILPFIGKLTYFGILGNSTVLNPEFLSDLEGIEELMVSPWVFNSIAPKIFMPGERLTIISDAEGQSNYLTSHMKTNSVKSVFFWDNIAGVADGVFAGCSTIERVSIDGDDMRTHFGKNVFAGTKFLENVRNSSNIRTIGDLCLFVPENCNEAIPEGIRSLDTGSVRAKRVMLPSTLENIYENAFDANDATEIEVVFCFEQNGKMNLKRIDDNAFGVSKIVIATRNKTGEDTFVELNSSFVATDIEFVGKNFINKNSACLKNIGGLLVFGETVVVGKADGNVLEGVLRLPSATRVVAGEAFAGIETNCTGIVVGKNVVRVGERAFEFASGNVVRLEIAGDAVLGDNAFLLADACVVVLQGKTQIGKAFSGTGLSGILYVKTENAQFYGEQIENNGKFVETKVMEF